MIIKKLILKGYKRLFLNKIDKLEYVPNKPMQIIIGRNGSGKSQTLKQLNPLPANLKQEFYDGGYKYIEIEHNNKLYILSSGYVSPGRHSFKLDDKELNDGGTRRVQLELIKDHFNITPEIVEILLNNNKLTTMSIVDRKKWLSELSTIDYTFSITVYNKLKSRHRDILGGVKLLQESIINYESNLVKEEDLIKLKEDKNILSQYYDHIISLYNHKETSQHDTNIKDINNKLKEYLSYNIIGNLDLLTNEKIKLESNIKSELETITNTNKLISNLEKIPEIKDIEELTKKRNEYQELYNKYIIYKPQDVRDEDTMKVYEDYSKIHIGIVSILNELLPYQDFINTEGDNETKIKELDNKLLINNSNLAKRIELIKTEITHLLSHKTQEHLTTCPMCQHKWYNGFNQSTYDSLIKQQQELEDRLKDYEELYKKNKDKLDKLEYINKLKDDLFLLFKTCYIPSIELDTKNFYNLLEIFNKLNTSLYNSREISVYKENIIRIDKILETYKETKKLESKDKQNQIDSLTKILQEHTIKKNKMLIDLQDLTKKINILTKMKEYHNQLKTHLKLLKSNLDNQVILLRNELLTELSNYIKEEIVKIEQTIQQQVVNNVKLEKDKKALEEYKTNEKILNIMVKELSPTEGLIAKSINSFLNVFIQEMNTVLDYIWTYPIELLPCEPGEDNDLDYKFRVRINNDEIIEDVNKLSSSGKEIVDLAFRLVFAKYMNLKEVPLYLDEFGVSLDPTHIIEAYKVIDKLIESEYPQIFMVCHFEHVYGNIQNADFNILDYQNVKATDEMKKNSCFSFG